MPIKDVAYRVSQQIKRTTDDHQIHALMNVIDAMSEYSSFQFWFNESRGDTEIYENQAVYTPIPSAPVADTGYIPADMIMPKRPWMVAYIGDPVDEKFEDRNYALDMKPMDYVKYYRNIRNLVGRPFAYTFYGGNLELATLPDRRYRMTLDYVRDLGVPQYRLIGSEWAFFEPDGATELDTSSWTNDWIKHAEPMIRFYAKYLMMANIYDDYDKAGVQKKLADDEFKSLSNRSANYDKQRSQSSDGWYSW